MSLVSEALRKARQEAAEKGAQQRGVVFRTTVVLGPKGTRVSVGWLAVFVVAAAALAGAGVAWWALSPRGSVAPAPASTVQAVSAAGVFTSAQNAVPVDAAPTAVPTLTPAPRRSAPAAGAAPSATSTPEPQPDRAATPIPRAGSEGKTGDRPARPTPTLTGLMPPVADVSAAPPVVTPEAPAARPTATRGTPATPPVATRGAPAAAGPARERERERSFVLDADLGKVKLHLDYIVYRSKDPFAGINGQQVSIGSIIEGFTVEEIGPEAVRLRDDRGAVVLRAH